MRNSRICSENNARVSNFMCENAHRAALTLSLPCVPPPNLGPGVSSTQSWGLTVSRGEQDGTTFRCLYVWKMTTLKVVHADIKDIIINIL